eukprot:gnl/Chilomastix_cuspidata/2838.p1 GENE.gnl/Chilomastix_cuspidata/2838~~gnl/Chilomastix_cuspidata/2838.p1  ORF type:complete len:1848 (+),score=472.25 gnl/Chilomastix_cuspidata/2838:45-5588(+)
MSAELDGDIDLDWFKAKLQLCFDFEEIGALNDQKVSRSLLLESLIEEIQDYCSTGVLQTLHIISVLNDWYTCTYSSLNSHQLNHMLSEITLHTFSLRLISTCFHCFYQTDLFTPSHKLKELFSYGKTLFRRICFNVFSFMFKHHETLFTHCGVAKFLVEFIPGWPVYADADIIPRAPSLLFQPCSDVSTSRGIRYLTVALADLVALLSAPGFEETADELICLEIFSIARAAREDFPDAPATIAWPALSYVFSASSTKLVHSPIGVSTANLVLGAFGAAATDFLTSPFANDGGEQTIPEDVLFPLVAAFLAPFLVSQSFFDSDEAEALRAWFDKGTRALVHRSAPAVSMLLIILGLFGAADTRAVDAVAETLELWTRGTAELEDWDTVTVLESLSLLFAQKKIDELALKLHKSVRMFCEKHIMSKNLEISLSATEVVALLSLHFLAVAKGLDDPSSNDGSGAKNQSLKLFSETFYEIVRLVVSPFCSSLVGLRGLRAVLEIGTGRLPRLHSVSFPSVACCVAFDLATLPSCLQLTEFSEDEHANAPCPGLLAYPNITRGRFPSHPLLVAPRNFPKHEISEQLMSHIFQNYLKHPPAPRATQEKHQDFSFLPALGQFLCLAPAILPFDFVRQMCGSFEMASTQPPSNLVEVFRDLLRPKENVFSTLISSGFHELPLLVQHLADMDGMLPEMLDREFVWTFLSHALRRGESLAIPIIFDLAATAPENEIEKNAVLIAAAALLVLVGDGIVFQHNYISCDCKNSLFVTKIPNTYNSFDAETARQILEKLQRPFSRLADILPDSAATKIARFPDDVRAELAPFVLPFIPPLVSEFLPYISWKTFVACNEPLPQLKQTTVAALGPVFEHNWLPSSEEIRQMGPLGISHTVNALTGIGNVEGHLKCHLPIFSVWSLLHYTSALLAGPVSGNSCVCGKVKIELLSETALGVLRANLEGYCDFIHFPFPGDEDPYSQIFFHLQRYRPALLSALQQEALDKSTRSGIFKYVATARVPNIAPDSLFLPPLSVLYFVACVTEGLASFEPQDGHAQRRKCDKCGWKISSKVTSSQIRYLLVSQFDAILALLIYRLRRGSCPDAEEYSQILLVLRHLLLAVQRVCQNSSYFKCWPTQPLFMFALFSFLGRIPSTHVSARGIFQDIQRIGFSVVSSFVSPYLKKASVQEVIEFLQRGAPERQQLSKFVALSQSDLFTKSCFAARMKGFSRTFFNLFGELFFEAAAEEAVLNNLRLLELSDTPFEFSLFASLVTMLHEDLCLNATNLCVRTIKAHLVNETANLVRKDVKFLILSSGKVALPQSTHRMTFSVKHNIFDTFFETFGLRPDLLREELLDLVLQCFGETNAITNILLIAINFFKQTKARAAPQQEADAAPWQVASLLRLICELLERSNYAQLPLSQKSFIFARLEEVVQLFNRAEASVFANAVTVLSNKTAKAFLLLGSEEKYHAVFARGLKFISYITSTHPVIIFESIKELLRRPRATRENILVIILQMALSESVLDISSASAPDLISVLIDHAESRTIVHSALELLERVVRAQTASPSLQDTRGFLALPPPPRGEAKLAAPQIHLDAFQSFGESFSRTNLVEVVPWAVATLSAIVASDDEGVRARNAMLLAGIFKRISCFTPELYQALAEAMRSPRVCANGVTTERLAEIVTSHIFLSTGRLDEDFIVASFHFSETLDKVSQAYSVRSLGLQLAAVTLVHATTHFRGRKLLDALDDPGWGERWRLAVAFYVFCLFVGTDHSKSAVNVMKALATDTEVANDFSNILDQFWDDEKETGIERAMQAFYLNLAPIVTDSQTVRVILKEMLRCTHERCFLFALGALKTALGPVIHADRLE